MSFRTLLLLIISQKTSVQFSLGSAPRAILLRRILASGFVILRYDSNMKTIVALLSFIIFLESGNGSEKKSQLQSHFWQYVSFNGTVHGDAESFSKKDTVSPDVKDRPRKYESDIFSSRLRTVLPPFAVTAENVKNTECKKDSEKFLQHLNEMQFWALKMHDSSGKIPSGLLNGNVNQFGDFDECVNIEEPNIGIKGKYCLAFLQIRADENDLQRPIFLAYKLMQSHFLFKSKLSDPGDRVPRFSTVHWGLCVPSSCSSQDVELQLKNVVDKFSNGTGFHVEVKVVAEMCQERRSPKVSKSFVIVSSLILSTVAIAILATVKDILRPEERIGGISIWSILNCFSLKENAKALVSVTRSSDDIESIHGIRMINALMLVLSHKSMALLFMPYSNRTAMVERLVQPWTIIARTASLYTDSFIMISGLLSCYSFIKVLKKGSLNFKNEYLGRLIRIVPSLAVVILTCTFILPELGSGPQWNLTVSHHAEKCKKNWWKNFLFIHNYLGFENMCLTHTHHLGIDTQLYLLSPLLISLLTKWPNYGVGVLVGLAGVSTAARYYATDIKKLSFFIYPGISVGQMFDTANFSYIIPFHRLTVYIIGIFLGYALRHYGKDYRIKPNVLRLGWTLTFTFLSYVLTKANEMNSPGYKYNSRDAAVYAAFAPIAWCLFLAWLTFVTHIGCGGFIGRVLSLKYCLIWTRLSYAVYLTQFPVFFFNVGLQKYPQQYSFFLLVNILEYGSVLVASIALTLLFEMPFGNLKKLLLPR